MKHRHTSGSTLGLVVAVCVFIITPFLPLVIVRLWQPWLSNRAHGESTPMLPTSGSDTDASFLNQSAVHARTALAVDIRRFPTNHPLHSLFEFVNFPTDEVTWDLLSNYFLEAITLLWTGNNAISEMKEDALSPTFLRYFDEEDYEWVKTVFASVMEAFGMTTGSITDRNWHADPNCSPKAQYIPYRVFYKYARADKVDYCDQNPKCWAYAENTDWDIMKRDVNAQIGDYYMVICPVMFSMNPPELAMAPRMSWDMPDPGTYASFKGEGGPWYPFGGMFFSGATIAHEILHNWDIYWDKSFEQLLITDTFYIPPGYSAEVPAYTPYQCQQLKRYWPDFARNNVNNFIFFALEYFWSAKAENSGFDYSVPGGPAVPPSGQPRVWQDSPPDAFVFDPSVMPVMPGSDPNPPNPRNPPAP